MASARTVQLGRVLDVIAKQKTTVPLAHVVAIGVAIAVELHATGDKKRTAPADVSPSNILIGFDDGAVAIGEVRPAKLAYTAPEACRGGPIDRRSDVYALGVVLYELATATRLFRGEDAAVTEAIVAGKVPLPRVRRPDLPNELSIILLRALATDPARRYATAHELAGALHEFALRAELAMRPTALRDFVRKLIADPEPTPRPSWEDLPRDSSDELRTRNSQASGRFPVVRAAEASGRFPVAAEASGRFPVAQAVEPLGPRRSRPSTAPPIASGAQIATDWQLPATRPPRRRLVVAAVIAIAAVVVAGAVVVWRRGDPQAPAAVAPASEPVADAPSREATVARPVEAAHGSAAPVGHIRPADAPKLAAPPAPAVDEPVEPAASPEVPTPAAPPPPALDDTEPAKPTEAPLRAKLSQVTVEGVARDHARELAGCHADDLHGEISVHFEIDGTGKVLTSQVTSTVGNPKMSACLLRTLATWQFPRPPTGSAQGVYTLVFP